MELASWLRSLGLERFEPTFRENAIDGDVLRDLKDDHLRELGLPMGARIKLLKAIVALPKEEAVIAPSIASPGDAAERRQITVMFSDLVGSTALSTRLDPEDLRTLISAYQKCVTETVQRCGGFVAKYMGDGVLIYFGYPQAHEDDAERAVRSALDLVAAVAKLKTDPRLQTRVGIATGMVVVGDLVGSGEAQERSIVGETPNLAARLQGLAEPDTVVIADATKRLLGNLFELKDLGHQELKGIAGAVQVWAALRPASVEGRFEAFHAGNLSSLIGRDEEAQLLERRWSKAKDGEGQVVLICGEAGIGKSRLTAVLLEHIDEEPHARLRCFCSPQRTNSALSPIIGHMERAAGLKHDDTARAKLDKLDVLLARSATSPSDSALLAELLSLPNDGRYPQMALDPQQRRQGTLQALVTQIEALSRSAPVLMIFEDAHWTDPTSLELVSRILERIVGLRVLMVVTFRPEFAPPWIGLPHISTITVNRLGRREIDAMIDRIVGNQFLPPAIREDMIDRTDGIPLFIEEMTKAILETESEEEARRTAAVIPSSRLEIPATLHASLMARLDRLGPAKELAQIGSAIGREFPHALIEAVAGKSRAELEVALHRLISAGLLFQQGVPPHAHYLFKHALIQDAAYSTLLREHRRVLHASIAETLEARFPDRVERQPELLARHCAEAGLLEKAAGLWAKAGQRSLERAALPEAAEQLSRALSLIAALPSTPALRREEIKLQVALITPLMHFRGYGAPETKAAALRARTLIEQAEERGEAPEDPLLLFSVLYSFWVANFNGFHADAVTELAAQFLRRAEEQKAATQQMLGHRLVGVSQATVGNLPEALAHFDRAIASYDPVEHRQLAAQFGQDIRIAALCYRSWIRWMLGYPDAALVDAKSAVSEAREVGQGVPLMYSLYFTSYALIHCGEYEAAKMQLDELVPLATEKNAAQWRGGGIMHRGCIQALTGKASDAIATIPSGIAAWQSSGSVVFVPWYVSHMARACGELGRLDDARRHIDDALKAIETTGETWCESDVRRTAGEIALLGPEPDVCKAEAHFARALAVAQEQKAKSWELRAATSLARLWRDRGDHKEASQLLAPVYNWFGEGFETLDLKQAKRLLHELA
ncbi:adenylate/guanylate cyclase domain-containing protein [Bradyrhizobium sp. Pha-3]|uniref:adenylate/guanylate cyclase domain-containing protein n=1 Tax=Bradyrhizobium sp. Pha-3 TaxID=208375 RepID=UPI0035D45084